MQIPETVAFVLSLIGTSGVISGVILRRLDKLEKTLESKENDRVKEIIISSEALEATARLTEANTMAIREATNTDVCEDELSAFKVAFKKLEQFMREKSAQYLHAN